MSDNKGVGETPKQLTEIGALPIPDPDMLDDDIKKYMAICEDKLGHIPNVVKVFSLRPAKLRTFIAKYNEMMLSDDSDVSRLEREMIAVVVSCVNRCVYCITSHSQAVREFSGDPVLGDILMVNYREANLTPRQRAILDRGRFTTADHIAFARVNLFDFPRRFEQNFVHQPTALFWARCRCETFVADRE